VSGTLLLENEPADRGPLRVLFMITSMQVGGAETLLVNLVRRLDRRRFEPEICCLKEPGPLGEMLSREMPVHSRLLAGKYDVRVLGRLTRLMRQRRVDAVVTVGAGDKMFWGRLAAWRVGVPVVLSALHSTGWPDGIGRLNRMLTPLTDGFIAVAEPHGRYLVEGERFPAAKVTVIPNGVDTQRFCPNPTARAAVRRDLLWHDDTPVFGTVAALRPEKNHLLFLRVAAQVRQAIPDARFLIVGDGPQRGQLEAAAAAAGLNDSLRMLGSRSDVPDLLAAMDTFVLTSLNEANPVSILEAMSVGLPVVSTRVGSIAETVLDGVTGYLAEVEDAPRIARCCVELAADPRKTRQLGARGRQLVVARWSLEQMVDGYARLISDIYRRKRVERRTGVPQRPDAGIMEADGPLTQAVGRSRERAFQGSARCDTMVGEAGDRSVPGGLR